MAPAGGRMTPYIGCLELIMPFRTHTIKSPRGSRKKPLPAGMPVGEGVGCPNRSPFVIHVQPCQSDSSRGAPVPLGIEVELC